MKNKQKLIEIKNVSFKYNDIQILKDINLTIYKGDFLAIIGPNGGGKTTLLKLILKILEPESGTIKYNDYFLNKGKKIGYVPQYTNFDKDFPIRVIDVVLMGLLSEKKFFKKYSKKDIELARKKLESLNILHLQDRYLSDLSGGQLQKVFIARAIIIEPEILILDEPTTFIDKRTKIGLSSFLKNWNEKGIAIILVTHDVGVISENVKQIACLNNQLHYHGDDNIPDKVLEDMYSCPVELIAHGSPHRVLKEHIHKRGENN